MKNSINKKLYLIALKQRANTYEMIGNYENALKDIETILSQKNNNPFLAEIELDKLSIISTIEKDKIPIEEVKKTVELFYRNNDLANYSKGILILVNMSNKLGNYSESLNYLKLLEKRVSKKKKNIHNLIMFSKGTIYWNMGQIQEALLLYKKVEKAGMNNLYDQFKLYNNLALIYSDLNNTEKELFYLNKAYKLANQIGYKRGTGITLLNLAAFYVKTNQLDKAEKNLRRALSIFKKINFIMAIEIVFSNLASVQLKRFQWNRGAYYIKKALKIAKKIGYKRGILTNYINLGITNLKKHKYEMARYYFEEAKQLADELNNSHLKIMCFIYYAELFYKLGDIKKVKEYLDKAFLLIFEKKEFIFLKEIYLILALYYYHINRELSIKILKKSLFLAEKERDYFQYIMNINEYLNSIDDEKLKNRLKKEIFGNGGSVTSVAGK